MDRAVRKTDDDAAASKYAAVLKGYYDDEYLQYFARRPAPRLPLINIGTYCRVRAMDRLVAEFLDRTAGAPAHAIVSLGAGSDTRAFHLLPQHTALEYVELDFPVKTRQKEETICAHAPLAAAAAAAGARYRLLGIDLRELNAAALDTLLRTAADTTEDTAKDTAEDTSDASDGGGSGSAQPLQALGRLRDMPTLVLSECCLCYLQPAAADGVLAFFAGLVPRGALSVALYEPVSLDDEFGRVMAENLAMRGLALPTIARYSTLAAQEQRLARLLGCARVGAADIATVYREWLPRDDAQRISRLEFLDEVEEMLLLLRHYCVAWGHPG